MTLAGFSIPSHDKIGQLTLCQERSQPMVEASKLTGHWSETEALEVLRDLLHKTCGIEPASVQLNSSLVNDLNVDSLGMLEAIIEAEDAFGVSIDAGELSPSLTIHGLIDILSSKGVIKS